MKKLSRRGWNNVLIVAIIASMAILNLPTIIKNNLLEQENAEGYPYIMNPGAEPQKMTFEYLTLERDGSDWSTNKALTVPTLELVQRWRGLNGTLVTDAMFAKLKNQLPKPNTLEVWYLDLEEPQRVTFYQLADFWLMKNWQQEWIAISVEKDYLFPLNNG